VLMVVVTKVEKRREDVPLVRPSVASKTLSVATDQRVMISWMSDGSGALHARSTD
jgi:translation initiation factor 2 gamma subunit (eIF-2gamma)